MTASKGSQFCYPIKELESEHLRIEPIHDDMETASLIHSLLDTRKEVFRYLPVSPHPDPETLHREFLAPVAADPTMQLYLLVAKNGSSFKIGNVTRSGQPAGMISYLHSVAANALTEIGWVVIFPEWQRTFVTTHATGLLLRYALSPMDQGGLGLRRVEWRCHNGNAPSKRAAERMGFVFEGVMRWATVLPFGKESNGRTVVEGAQPGRDTALYSITWEDWLNDGKQQHVEHLMARPA